MKIIFFGSDHFAEIILKALHTSKCGTLLAVITTPDAKQGRGQHVASPPVKVYAQKMNLPCLQPPKLKNPDFLATLANFSADIFFVVSYGKILPREVLQIPKYYSINIHPSLLPKYRGPSPINYALLNGDSETGFSVIKLNEKIDGGDLFYQERLLIDSRINAVELTELLAHAAAMHIAEIISACESSSVTFSPQDDSVSSYAGLLKKSDGIIDWSRSATSIHNKVRALLPWPTAFASYKGKMLKLYSTDVVSDCDETQVYSPGTIVAIHKSGGMDVATNAGIIRVFELQYEGKKRMRAFDWCNGQRVSVGEALSSHHDL